MYSWDVMKTFHTQRLAEAERYRLATLAKERRAGPLALASRWFNQVRCNLPVLNELLVQQPFAPALRVVECRY